MGEVAAGGVVEDGGDVVGSGGIVVIWRAAFDLLPVLLPNERPTDHGCARWKVQSGDLWFVYEQEPGKPAVARLPFIVDASMVATWIAPLRRQARLAGDADVERVLALVAASLDAADAGFRAFEGALAGAGDAE